MSERDACTPVLVGAGQVTQREPEAGVDAAELMARASRAAADDAGAGQRLLAALDTIAVPNVLCWPYVNPARLVAERGVRGLIVDVSALSIVDSFVAKILGEIGAAANALGVRGVLVGLRPAVAITLVELGLDLGGLETAMSLERALQSLRMRVVADE